MTNELRSPVILVANNPFGHHLLVSQLLNVYRELQLNTRVILLCNGVMPNVATGDMPPIEVVSFAARGGGVASYFKLILKLAWFRWKYPQAAYHLRGFVAGMLFLLSRLCFLRKAHYIYDPRGAFFIEWRESGRPKPLSRMFGWVESRLICHSAATIVTSERFLRLYRRLFGHSTKYLTIYNSTSFAFSGGCSRLPTDGRLRFVYMGTFNHWHDMDELFRVMSEAARQLGPDRVEIFIYTLPRFHQIVNDKFARIGCAMLQVDYVTYDDIPQVLVDKHIGVSVVRPTLSSCIASPIKVADYVALGLVPLLSQGIGDFDAHFRKEGAAILYKFGGALDMSGLEAIRTAPNRKIYDLVSKDRARARLALAVERLRNG